MQTICIERYTIMSETRGRHPVRIGQEVSGLGGDYPHPMPLPQEVKGFQKVFEFHTAIQSISLHLGSNFHKSPVPVGERRAIQPPALSSG